MAEVMAEWGETIAATMEEYAQSDAAAIIRLHIAELKEALRPTTILAFRTEMLEKRGDRAGAIRLLDIHARSLRERHVSAWLKIWRC